ncbi:MAG: hypothetical protein U1E14_20620 [Geminicoccaceae bacterium]
MPSVNRQRSIELAMLAADLAEELRRATELQGAATEAALLLREMLAPALAAGLPDPRIDVLKRLATACGITLAAAEAPPPAPEPRPEGEPAATGGAHAYAWSLPWLPASPGEVEVLPVPVTGLFAKDGGDPAKLTLLVAPEETITGKIVLQGWRSRGIVMIGFTARWAARGSRTTPAKHVIPFGHWCQITFAADGTFPSNPFVFIANGHWEAVGVQAGDWLQVGTARDGNNIGAWPDVILQKLFIPNGHYFFSDPTFERGTAQSFDPHSDGVQVTDNRGFRSIRVANCDWRWTGQTLFARSTTQRQGRPHPEAQLVVRSTMFRAQPPAIEVYPEDGCRQPVYVAVAADPATDFPNEDFVTTVFEDVFAEFSPSSRLRDPRRYFSPNAASGDGDVAAWPDTTYGGRRPMTGTVRFGEPPKPVLDPAHCGWRHRVASFDDLAAIF